VESVDALPAPAFDRSYTREALDEDFQRFREIIYTRHPLLYADRAELDAVVASRAALLRDGMNELEFLRLLAPIVATLRCGHSWIGLSAEYADYLDREGSFFPLDVAVIGEGIFVIGNVTHPEVPAGSELLSINGKSGSDIVGELMRNLPADGRNETNKVAMINRWFAWFFRLFVDGSRDFDTVWRGPEAGKTSASTLRALPRRELFPGTSSFWQDPKDPPVASAWGPTLGYLKFRSFHPQGEYSINAYNRYTDEFFKELEAKGLRSLILDLSDNGGGDPMVASHLFSYLSTEPHPYFAPEIPDFYPGLKKPVPLAAHRFDGRLFVLMNGASFSTTGHLLALLKDQGRAVFIGEESGGSFACADSSDTVRLRNTGLQFKYSTQVWKVAVTGLEPGRGILPNYEVSPSAADLIQGRDVRRSFAEDLAASLPLPLEDIVYSVTYPDGHNELLTMREDGSGRMPIARIEGRPLGPALSPDGKSLAFYNHRSDSSWSLHLLDLASGAIRDLAGDRNTLDWSPRWSKDGRRLFFTRSRPAPRWSSEIWAVDLDGSSPRRIGGVEGQGPDCSPDGKLVAFYDYVEGGGDIWTMGSDGSNPTRLTEDPAEDWWPAFSPDGGRIAFQTARDGNFEIYTMKADGTDLKRLTYDKAEDAEPRWSPDGRRLLFSSMRDGHYEIYLMNSDGSDQHRLTKTAGEAINADWCAARAFPASIDSSASYLFYLPAAILEDGDHKAVDPLRGEYEYEYEAIVKRLSGRGFRIVSERRLAETGVAESAARLRSQVEILLQAKVPARNITIVGASKGAAIAILASSLLATKGIRYVLLGSCHPDDVAALKREGVALSGDVLAIRDSADPFAGPCQELFDFSAGKGLGRHEEILLHLGLGHGLVFGPRDEWILPTLAWAEAP
jgi:hypothetical protein